MTKDQVAIYGLVDPRDHTVRYIGKTSKSLAKRLKGHLDAAKRGEPQARCKWTRKLLGLGLEPIIVLLEMVPEGTWVEAEQRWIAYGREQGWRLLNHTDGGDGARGWKPSAEIRARMSASHRASETPERRAQRSRTLREIGHQPPHRHGSAANGAVLNEQKVAWLRREVNGGRPLSECARELGVSVPLAHMAAIGKTWAHVEEPVLVPGSATKLSDDNVREIRYLVAEGMSQKDVAKKFGVHSSHVSRIVRGSRGARAKVI